MSTQSTEPTIESVKDRIRARFHELEAQTFTVHVIDAYYLPEDVCEFLSADEYELAPQAAIDMFRTRQLGLQSTPTLHLNDAGLSHLANEFFLGHRDIMNERWQLTDPGRWVYPQSERNRNYPDLIHVPPVIVPVPRPPKTVIISDYSSGQPNGKFTEQIPSPPPKPQQKRRIWLLILAILIIAAVEVTSVMPNIQSDAATPTASRQRMVAATSDLQCATRGRIARNQIVTICDGRQAISVLEGPVTSAREMHLLQAGERVTVVGGPACPDGATWWQVRTSNRITGWVDEGDEQVGFYLCPANN